MEQFNPRIRPGWLRAVLFFLFFIFSISVLGSLGLAITAIISNNSFDDYLNESTLLMDNNTMILMMIFQLIATVFSVWIFQKFINRESFLSIGLDFYQFKDDFTSGLLLGAGFISIGFGVLYILNYIEVVLVQISYLDQLIYILLFIIVSLNEEIAIRGYILKNLCQSFNKYIALVFSSMVFMLMHIGNPNISILSVVNLFLAGIFLGIYCIHKNNLWFPIGAHFTWNYFQGPIFGFEVSGNKVKSLFNQNLIGSDIITGGEFGFEGSILLTFLMIIGIIYVDIRYSTLAK